MYKRHLTRIISLTCLAAILVTAACTDPKEKYEKYMERAQSNFEAENFPAAHVELLNAIKVNPTSGEAYHLMARTLAKLQDQRGALSSYESALELDPGNGELLLEYVELLIAGKDYDRTVILLRGALERDPENVIFQRHLSRALVGTGKTREAVEVAHRLTVDQPESAENWFNLVNVSLLAHETERAETALAAVGKMVPSEDPRLVLAEVDLLLSKGEYAGAAGRLQLLMERYPQNMDYALRMAQIKEMMGRTQEVIALYRMILEHEERIEVRNRLGVLLQQTGDKEEAAVQWRKILEINPYAVEPRINLARSMLEKGEKVEAWKMLNDAIDIDPVNRDALALRGWISLDRGNFLEAISDLQKVVEQGSAGTDWKMALARAYAGSGDTGSARMIFEEVVNQDPGNGEAHLALARILSREGEYLKSSESAQRAASLGVKGSRVNEILGANALAMGNHDDAVGFFQRALTSDPGNPGLRMRLAVALDGQGKTEASLDILGKLLEDRPEDLVPLSVYTRILVRTGRLTEALDAVRRYYRQTSPGHGLLLAATLERAGQVEEAEAMYRSVVEGHPDFGPAYFQAVAFYARQGRLDEARVWLADAIKGKKEGRYGLNLLLGMLQAAAGDTEAAMASYRTSLEENPDFVPALNNLAWALAEEGKLEEALEISSKGRGIDPTDPLLADTHGWILYRSGNATGALPLIRQAVADQPSNTQIRAHLIEILEAVGRSAEAAEVRAILEEQRKSSTGRDNSP